MTPTNPTPAATSQLLPCPFCEGHAITDCESDTDYPSRKFMFVRCTRCGVKTSSIYGSGDPSEWADARYNWNRRAAAIPLVQDAEPLCGWKIDAAQQAQDSDGDPVTGVWELGHLDGDGNFYAIATVDTGNYDQPEAAEPLARAIIAKLTERATGVQATEVAPREGSPDDMLTVAHVTTDGGGILTMLAASLGDLIDIVGDEPETYSVSIATMKRADFEAMGEFDGF